MTGNNGRAYTLKTMTEKDLNPTVFITALFQQAGHGSNLGVLRQMVDKEAVVRLFDGMFLSQKNKCIPGLF